MYNKKVHFKGRGARLAYSLRVEDFSQSAEGKCVGDKVVKLLVDRETSNMTNNTYDKHSLYKAILIQISNKFVLFLHFSLLVNLFKTK